MESGAQQIFVGKEDNYGGLVVNLMEMEHMTAQDFESKLDLNGRFRYYRASLMGGSFVHWSPKHTYMYMYISVYLYMYM